MGTALHVLVTPCCIICPTPNSKKTSGAPTRTINITYATRNGAPPCWATMAGRRETFPKHADKETQLNPRSNAEGHESKLHPD